MAFRFSLEVSASCTQCKRTRDDLPTGAALAQGETTLVVQDSERCPQCGCDRVTVRPRVKQQQ